ncbi:hypothetical protein NEOLEDRAFT_618687 [Neolentinus lepideus HHB14362 ss-1]|uniref:Uncharacterized protein n=1 Tax=Neolentinus lepideus HHB14362 ss-1 TaxID=1314782 RepID=A0A165QWA7_9AGAM|nr:hypothetical protein NEOLEDRAFT_618687 [Neolentinus lepideus HHB14362 ss-1]
MASYDAKTTQDDLQSYFDVYASSVRHSFTSFEERYARPLVDRCAALARDRPVLATFAGVFALLSILPVLAFIGFSLFTLASLAFLALLGLCISSTIALTTYSSILLATLTILLFTSLFLTLCLVASYFIVRLGSHIRSEGVGGGAGAWAREVRGRLVGEKPEITMRKEIGEEDERGSEDSGVVVKQEDLGDGDGAQIS